MRSQNRICDAEAVTISHETRISGSALEVKKRTCPRGRKGTGLWGLWEKKRNVGLPSGSARYYCNPWSSGLHVHVVWLPAL